MMETILHGDEVIFHWINHGWSNPVFDIILPAIRNKYFWLPLYILVIAWIMFNHQIRGILYILSFLTLSIFASDTISSRLIKDQIQRPRPCHGLQMNPPVQLRVNCGSGFSFTSSHAANHFCFAAFMIAVFGHYMRQWKYLWWIWAALISIAQVYVGIHYPLDILGGAMLGIIVGMSMGKICHHKIILAPAS